MKTRFLTLSLRSTTPLVVLATLPFANACSELTSEELENLGNASVARGGTSSSGGTPSWSVPGGGTATYAPFSDFYGRWVGEAMDVLAVGSAPAGSSTVYRFPSGSSKIVLTLAANPENMFFGPVGTLTFGEGELPAPPTAPDQSYPVSYVELFGRYADDPSRLAYENMPLPPFEGFAYFAHQKARELEGEGAYTGAPDGLLRLVVNSNEVLAPLCELQTPIFARGSYRCAPLAAGESYDAATNTCWLDGVHDTSRCPPNLEARTWDELLTTYDACVVPGPSIAIDCNRLYLCGGTLYTGAHCMCDSAYCRAGEAPEYDLDLSLRRHGDTLVGIFEDSAFLNERGVRVPLGQVTLRRAD